MLIGPPGRNVKLSVIYVSVRFRKENWVKVTHVGYIGQCIEFKGVDVHARIFLWEELRRRRVNFRKVRKEYI